MIYSIINIVLAVYILIYGFRIRFRGADSYNARLVFYFCLLSSFISFSIGFANMAAQASFTGMVLFFLRLGGACIIGSHFIVLLLAISFPYERSIAILRYALGAVLLFLSFQILFTGNYLQSTNLETGLLSMITGPFYNFIVLGGILVGLISSAVLYIRRVFFESKIFRLQTLIVASGLIVGYVLMLLLGFIFPILFNQNWIYLLMPLSMTLLALVLGYSVSITRLLDIRTVALSGTGSLIFNILVGAAAGLLFALGGSTLNLWSPDLSPLIGGAVYILVYLLSKYFRTRFSTVVRGVSTYAERLEEGLSAIDYAQGRDKVIENFIDLMKTNVACSSVHLMIENNQGEMVIVGSTNSDLAGQKTPASERKSAGIELLLNNDVSIIMKTEIITNYEYHDVKKDLLDLLDQYDAEAMVLLREGRSIIGTLLLGSKLTGGDFLDYDYETLRRVYGKIFVSAYYLKNVAQESLVLTVDRELEYSEQIIQSIQENMDRIEHPSAEIAFMTRSTRKLGGDFIDFIRISKDKYIFVLGDVSGKGLNASMSMVILKSVVRTFLREIKDFKDLVNKTNSFIKNNLPRGTFFAGMFGLFDFEKRTLYYVNCGVPAMFLLSSAYNNPVEIQGAGKVLGFVKDISPYINVRKASFKGGDLLLVTTDGLTDAESVRGVRFGKERIQTSIQENRSASAERIVQFLYDDVAEFVSQELNDDITILTIKFT